MAKPTDLSLFFDMKKLDEAIKKILDKSKIKWKWDKHEL